MNNNPIRYAINHIREDVFLGINIAFHSRLTSLFLWILITLVVTVLLVTQFSARQPATVALDVGISVIRITLPLLSILLIQALISNELDRKLYLNSFTYPRPRVYWLLGRVFAIILIGIGLLTVMGLVLALLSLYAGGTYEQATPISLGIPYITTLAFTAADLLVVVSIGSLFAVTASTPSFVLIGTMGFVVIARSYTPIIELLRSNPYVVSSFSDPHLYQDSLGMLAFILPDLGRLDIRMLALYDKPAFLPEDWVILIVATIAYAVALLSISTWVLNKREFN